MLVQSLEYFSVLKRRKTLFFGIFLSILLISLIVTLRWNNYRTFATIEVASPEISMKVVETAGQPRMTAEELADLQISRLKQRVLSTSSLSEIITKLNLYPEERRSTPIAYIAEKMRKKIRIQLVSTALANPASAQKASATQLSAIAFIISFEYTDPLLVQKGLSEIVSRFIEEDLNERRNTTKKTSEFLDGQINILSENLEAQEKKIAEFRAQNGDMRPDALSFNQQAVATTTSRLLAIESELVSNLGVIGALRSQLSQTEPYARVLDEEGAVLTTPSIQLRALKSQYAALKAKYGPDHPDVIKTARQVDAMEGQVDPGSVRARLQARKKDVTARLLAAKNKYGAEHPDVTSLEKQVFELDKQIKNLKGRASDGPSGVIADADNPSYLQIVAQIEAAQQQQKALEQQREEIKKQEQGYRTAVANNPQAEQQMAMMARDYENLMALYRDLRAKKLAADMSETIEQGSIGKRLSVIEAPQVPLNTSPSRKLFAAAGFAFAMIAAVCTLACVQILNQSIMGPHHLKSIIGVTPLVTIPNLKTIDEKIADRNRWVRILTFSPIILAIALCIFFAVVIPFDVFWVMLTRKLGF